MAYVESEADILRRERDRLKQDAAYQADLLRTASERMEAAERSAAALRGQVTKLKRRVSAGVCPCCSRSFDNLRRHMEAKHPDFRVSDDNIVPFKAEAV